MPIFVYRLLRVALKGRAIVLPGAVIVFVFLTSWPLMVMAEPADATITEPASYWWWFIVTAATVGYGDLYPTTPAGHAVGVYVIIGGIATLTTLFAQLAGIIERAKGRRMKGSITVDASDHIVILGYTPGRTERIVAELLADGRRPVVLGAWAEVDVHPMPEQRVDFVRGDLTDEAVLRRAGVHRAGSVLVDAHDDNEALAMLVSVDHVSPGTHVVVALRDLSRTEHLRYVNADVRCVQWHSPRMITEELQDPGISQVYAELMTHGGSNTYSVRLPESFQPVPFGECLVVLGKRFDATLLAASSDGNNVLVSPSWHTPVPAGSVLYYVGRQRITGHQVVDALRRG